MEITDLTTDRLDKTFFTMRTNRISRMLLWIAFALCLVLDVKAIGSDGVQMDFIIKRHTVFNEKHSNGSVVLSPNVDLVEVTPLLINNTKNDVFLVTRNISCTVFGHNVAYETILLAYKGRLVKESAACFGIVSLAPGEVASLLPFSVEAKKGDDPFVVDYTVAEELAKNLSCWTGTVTGRFRLNEETKSQH